MQIFRDRPPNNYFQKRKNRKCVPSKEQEDWNGAQPSLQPWMVAALLPAVLA